MARIAAVLTEEYFDSGRRACWGLGGEFNQPYMRHLRAYLVDEESKHGIFPKPDFIFNALDETTPEEVKVVIIGQDPYPWPGQAHGLAFSIKSGTPQPCASLPRIFGEIARDIGHKVTDGRYCLTPWAQQGVLLLNRALTVRQNEKGEHLDKGWECFTDKVVETINGLEHVVFMLWGGRAQEVCGLIDSNRHKVLCSPHPTYGKGLRGSKHFSQANEYLVEHGKKPINWLDVS